MADDKTFNELYDAYVYAYPAVILEISKQRSLYGIDEETPRQLNRYYHHAALADASFKNVVCPNIDTVYSEAFLDLTKGPLVLEKPAHDRYLTITFLDAYTNCENYVGTGVDGNDAKKYLITGPDFDGAVDDKYKQIALPTNYIWSIIRTIVYDKADLTNVKKIQSQIKLHYLDGTEENGNTKGYDSAYDYKPVVKTNGLPISEFFNIFNKVLVHNTDKYAPVDDLKSWEKYGIGAGKTFTEEADINALSDKVRDKFLKETHRDEKYGVTRGQWSFSDFSIGIYKKDYFLRANVAVNGLGANPVDMCLYAGAYRDAADNILDGSRKYRIHFEKGQLPPVKKFGFWSITLYDNISRYLVDNEIDRYGINDRDKLVENADGSIDILIQKDRPSEKYVSNWIPSEAAPFNLVFRIYLPEESVISGEWKTPEIVSD